MKENKENRDDTKQKFTSKDYIIAVVLAVLLFAAAYSFQIIIHKNNPKDLLMVMSNAAFASGAFLFGGGVLSWVRKDGQFDSITFGFHQIKTSRIDSIGKKFQDPFGQDSYLDYKRSKYQKRRTNIPWLIVGLLVIIIAAIMAYIYMEYQYK